MLRDEKWRKHRKSVELWKAKHRQYYLFQKRALASRPEYLALRRARYRQRKQLLRSQAEQQDLSAMEILYEFETTDEEFRRPGDFGGTGAESAQGWDWPCTGLREEPQATV